MSFFKNTKNILRMAAFIAASAAAVFFITRGVLQIGHRDPGYYDVGLTDQGNAILYGSGVHLLVYEEGSSSRIRQELNRIQKVFSEVLSGTYKLLDPKQTYEEIPNIASLNQNPGGEIRIGETLFTVLEDALERSERNEGYDLFSGALFREWETLLYQENPSDFDPLLDGDEAELLASLTSLLQKPETASLELIAPDKAVLHVSAEYLSFAETWGLDGTVLDLNLLHDAWLLQLTAEGLKTQGITSGYLYSESGCSLWLDEGERKFSLYGYDGSIAEEAGTVTLTAPLAYCQFTAFPVTEDQKGYYRLTADDHDVLRHPFISSTGGEPGKVLQYAVLSSAPDQIVNLAYHLTVMNTMESEGSVTSYAAALSEDIFILLNYQTTPHQFHLREKDLTLITQGQDTPYTLIPLDKLQ